MSSNSQKEHSNSDKKPYFDEKKYKERHIKDAVRKKNKQLGSDKVIEK